MNATLRAVYDGETLPLEPLGDANRPPARPAAPKRRAQRAAILAQAVDESIYTAEVINSAIRTTQHAPPQRGHAHRTFPARPQHARQQRPDKKDEGNSLGVAGLTTAIVGLFTCGLFSPVGLILSMFGLLKAPRGHAFAGTIAGSIGSVALAFAITLGLFTEFNTAIELEDAATSIDCYYYDSGDYPTEEEADSMLAGREDAWGQPLRYERRWPEGFEIRSAGLDGSFGTSDDHKLVR